MIATAKITKRSTMQEVLRARRRLAETAQPGGMNPWLTI